MTVAAAKKTILFIRLEKLDVDLHNTSADYCEVIIEEVMTAAGDATGQYRLVEYWGLLGKKPMENVLMRQASHRDCFKKLMWEIHHKHFLQLTKWSGGSDPSKGWQLVDLSIHSMYGTSFHELVSYLKREKGMGWAVEVEL